MLSQTENTLSGIVKSLTRADQLTIQALNGPNGEKELKAIGAEIDQILKQVVYLANTKRARSLSFGGNSAEKPPFADDGTYQGGEKM